MLNIKNTYTQLNNWFLINTDADVALASNGKRPPHALHNISAIWEIICTILIQNIWLSIWFIDSVIDLVWSLKWKPKIFKELKIKKIYDRQRRISASIESKTLCNKRICIDEYLNSEIVNGGNWLDLNTWRFDVVDSNEIITFKKTL